MNKAESDQMVEALKKRGIEVPYIVKANEGHGFSNEVNRFEFYRAMEEFLGKHLGGRVEKTQWLKLVGSIDLCKVDQIIAFVYAVAAGYKLFSNGQPQQNLSSESVIALSNPI